MSSVYSGNPGNVSLASGVSVTIPSDGDARTASSINVTSQKEADYLEALRTQSSASLTYVANPGNAPSTNYYCWAGPSQAAVAVSGTVSAKGQTTHMVARAGTLRYLVILTGQTTAGGTVGFQLLKNGLTAGLISFSPIAAGTVAGTVLQSTLTALAVVAGDYLELLVQNNLSVTASIGLSLVTLAVTPG